MSSDEWRVTALLGTSRSTGSPACPHPGLESVWSALGADGPARAVLDACALSLVASSAGALPLEADDPVAAAPVEERPRVGARRADALRRMIAGEHAECLVEWLDACIAANEVVTSRDLPVLLDLGRRDASKRTRIVHVMGTRGAWLASHESSWPWAIESTELDDDVWVHGSEPERAAYLARAQDTDPERAAALVTEEWSTASADFREAMLAVVVRAPHPCLEGVLESKALSDRRASTRRLAVAALVRIPGSGLTTRAFERARRILVRGTGSVASLVLELPHDRELGQGVDGLDPKPPKGCGARAHVARQLLARVPIASWCAHFGVDAAELFRANSDPEWRDVVTAGFADSMRLLPQPDCAVDFLRGVLLAQEWHVGLLGTRESWTVGWMEELPHETVDALVEALFERETDVDLLVAVLLATGRTLDGANAARCSSVVLSWFLADRVRANADAAYLALCIAPTEIRSVLARIASLDRLSSAAEAFARTLEFRTTYLEPSQER
ncbi:MAG: DUF5691 domain-containing protein [Planctomycetota bacterium]